MNLVGKICWAITLLISFLLSNSGQSVKAEDSPYDWIISIQTEEVKGYQEFPGARLNPLVKAGVTYRSTSSDDQGETKYEDLFYGASKPIGCKRYRSLGISKGDGVAIRVKHRRGSPTSAELAAAANSIIRLLVDTYLNSNPLQIVLVPPGSFNAIAQELGRNNFIPFETAIESPVFSFCALHLQAEPDGQSRTLYFSPSGE